MARQRQKSVGLLVSHILRRDAPLLAFSCTCIRGLSRLAPPDAALAPPFAAEAPASAFGPLARSMQQSQFAPDKDQAADIRPFLS